LEEVLKKSAKNVSDKSSVHYIEESKEVDEKSEKHAEEKHEEVVPKEELKIELEKPIINLQSIQETSPWMSEKSIKKSNLQLANEV